MKKIFLAFICFQTTFLFSQIPSAIWSKSFGGTSTDESYAVAFDGAGNVCTGGRSSGTVDFDPGTGIYNLSTAGSTPYITKFDANGNFLWARNMPGDETAIILEMIVDVSGNVYATGYFRGTLDIDPGPSTNNVTATGGVNNDVFIVKLDAAGNSLWSKTFGNADAQTSWSLDIDNLGNIYVTGTFDGTVDIDPGIGTFNLTAPGAGENTFILKLDNAGDFIWAKSFAGIGNIKVRSIKTNSSGVYVTGDFQGTADFDPGIGTFNVTAGSTTYDAYIVKLDLNGNFEWVKNMAGASGRAGGRTLFVNETEIYLSGSYSGTADLDPGIGTSNFTSVGGNDIFILKMDISGNLTWVKGFGGTLTDFSTEIIADGTSVYLSGYFQGTVDFDPDSGVSNKTTMGQNDAFISKFTSGGSFEWVKTYGSTGHDFANSITVSSSNLFVSGSFENTVDFDGSSLTHTLNSVGGYDVYVLKLGDCIATSSSVDTMVCTSYTWPQNSQTYNVSGAYNDTITNVAGCDSIITLNLTIDDVIAPVANVATLSNVTSECSVTSLTAPTATDNCAGSITGTHNASLPITTQGTTTVTWTYNDGNGNTSTQTQNVVIDDNTAPVANVANLANVTSQCSVTILTAPTATDNCAGSITGIHNASLPITAQGTTTVTWTYNDGNGNTSTQTQSVVIDDNTAPVTNVATLSNVTSECSVTSLTAPTATDNCSGSITGTHNASLPITAQGTTTVTWTYNDGNGNTSTQTQSVVITPINNGITQTGTLTLSANAGGYDYQWVDCNNGNQAINGETDQTFTATANGSYAVEIDNGSCTVTSNCITISTVGIDALNQKNWKVYPNPANEKLIVELEENTNIQILDIFGKIVQTETLNTGKNNIDVSTLTSGVYFIQAGANPTVKFVKK